MIHAATAFLSRIRRCSPSLRALFVATFAAFLSPCAHADELVALGAVWRYLDDGSDQGTAWREPSFDDSGWKSGPAQFGFGDGDEATVIARGAITYYFRHSFTAATASPS